MNQTMQEATLLLLNKIGFSEKEIKKIRHSQMTKEEFHKRIMEGGKEIENRKKEKDCNRYAEDTTIDKGRIDKPP